MNPKNHPVFNISSVQWRVFVTGGLCLLMGLTVFQDYLYADLKHTGFYWTESLLYNTIWLYFIPLIYLLNRLAGFITNIKPLPLLIYALLASVVGTFLHLFLFTSLFILTSQLLFDPPHRFSAIFTTAISNQLYLTCTIYALILPFHHYRSSKNICREEERYPDRILLKSGSSQLALPISAIISITTDRPYSLIRTTDQKFFHHASLSQLEKQFDPSRFIRVHRSAIIRKNAVTNLTSRKNGDYDAELINGQSISR